MRIALVSSTSSRCGIYRYTKRLADELRLLGVEVDIHGFENIVGVADRYDVVHIQHEWGLIGYRVLDEYIDRLRKKTRRLVVTFHNIPFPMMDMRRGVVEAVEETRCVERVCMCLDAVVTTLGLGRDVVRYVCHTRVVHIRHGMDIKHVSASRDIDVFIHAPNRIDIDTNVVESIKSFVGGNIYVHRDYLPDEKLFELLSRSRIVVLPYRDIPGWIYTSGFMYLALGFLGTVVVTTSWVRQSDLARDGLEMYTPPFAANIKVVYMLHNIDRYRDMYMKKVMDLQKLYSWRSVAVEHLELYESLYR